MTFSKSNQEAILARSDAEVGWKEEESCPVCRPHRSRSLGFFPTCATNIPKYLVWLYTRSSISSAGVTRHLSIYQSLVSRPGQSVAVCSHRGTLGQWTTL